MTTESEAIGAQSYAVSEISTNLAAVSESARGLRERFKTLNVASCSFHRVETVLPTEIPLRISMLGGKNSAQGRGEQIYIR